MAGWFNAPCSTANAACSTTTCATDMVWNNWTTAVGVATTNVVWGMWVNGSYVPIGYQAQQAGMQAQGYLQRSESDKERNARLQRLEQRQREENERQVRFKLEQEEAEKKAKLAKEKALKLLMEHLTEVQIENFNKNKCFDVDGRSGDKYQISLGRSGNIRVFDKDGKYRYKLCCHPIEQVPDYDTVLAQKIWLECDEAGFLALANKS